MSQKILIDWGSTVIKDEYLFNFISYKSGNKKVKWDSPRDWDRIREIGTENFFDEIQDSYFIIGEEYPKAKEVLNSFLGTEGYNSSTETFIIYDNNPLLKKKNQEISRDLSFALSLKDIKVNGSYISRDKLSIAKSIGASVLIDDDPRIAIAFAIAGIKTILMLRKWNRFFNINDLKFYMKEEYIDKAEHNIIICEDWDDVELALKVIIGKHEN